MLRPAIPLTVLIPAPMLDGLGRMARERGWKKELLASELLCAAYTARLQPVGDAVLEAAVAQIGEPASADDENCAVLQRANTTLREEIARLHGTIADERRTVAMRDEKIIDLSRDLSTAQERTFHLPQRIETLEAQLFDATEKIAGLKLANEQLASELCTGQPKPEEIKATAPNLPPYVTFNLNAEPIVAPELQAAFFAAAAAARPLLADPPDPLAGLADCTRRMILSLKACGLSPAAIARQVDQPVDVVKAVLAKAASPRRK